MTPREHEFSYDLFMMYLDLDELPELFKAYRFWSSEHFNLAYFNRKDHLGDETQSLKQSVTELVLNKTGIELTGPIRLLTHLRYFGYGFNPVSFYYCFNQQDTRIQAIVAEVNNTPWGEQFCYVFANTDNQDSNTTQHFEFDKAFHVSPFNPMEQHYKWAISSPRSRLAVHIENWRDNEKVFDATLSMKAKVINSASLKAVLYQFPLVTVKIMAAIYYQALKLWLKGVPFYSHPEKQL